MHPLEVLFPKGFNNIPSRLNSTSLHQNCFAGCTSVENSNCFTYCNCDRTIVGAGAGVGTGTKLVVVVAEGCEDRYAC